MTTSNVFFAQIQSAQFGATNPNFDKDYYRAFPGAALNRLKDQLDNLAEDLDLDKNKVEEVETILEPLVELLLDCFDFSEGGALVKQTPADDDCVKNVTRIEDREYFFNDMFSCVIAELQELQAWVNNLDSKSDSLDNQNPQLFSWASEEDEIDALNNMHSWMANQVKENNPHIEDEWVNNNPFQVGDLVNIPEQVDNLQPNNPQIEDWDNIFDGSAIPDQIMAQLVDWSNCDEDDALDNLNLWFTSQAKSEEEGSTLPVIDESQLNDWVNIQTEVDSLVKTSLHYQVLYGGKVLADMTLVEGGYETAWILTSGGTSYKSPYDFHTCMSKQVKKAPCSAT